MCMCVHRDTLYQSSSNHEVHCKLYWSPQYSSLPEGVSLHHDNATVHPNPLFSSAEEELQQLCESSSHNLATGEREGSALGKSHEDPRERGRETVCLANGILTATVTESYYCHHTDLRLRAITTVDLRPAAAPRDHTQWLTC